MSWLGLQERFRRIGQWIRRRLVQPVRRRLVQPISRALSWITARLEKMWDEWTLMRLGVVLTVAVLLFTAMSGFDGAIGEMHVPGAASHTPTSIMNPGWPWGEDHTLSDALTVWQTWVSGEWEPGWPTPRWFLQLWLGLDLIFAVLVAALLARWRRRILDAPPFSNSENLEDLTSSLGTRERVMGAWNAVLLTGPLISLYLLSDLAENLVTAGVVAVWPVWNETSGLSAQTNLIQGLSAVKMASLGFVAIPALLATLLLRQQSRPSVPGAWIVLRTQVIAAAVFGVLFLRTDQVGDVIYMWSERRYQASLAFLATVLSSFTIVVSGVWLSGRPTREPGRDPIKPLKWVAGGLSLGAVAFVFLILLGDASLAALVLPGAIIAFGLLSIPAFVASAGSEGPPALDFRGVGRWLRWLALVPPVAVALAIVRVLPNAFFVGEEWIQFQWPLWVFIALVIGVTAVWVVGTNDATLGPESVRDPAFLLYLAVVLTGIGVGIVLANDQAGTLAVTAIFSSAVCLTLIPFGRLRLRPARGPIRVLGFRRVPAFALLLGWAVLAASFDSEGGFHDAQLTDREVEVTDAITLEDAWDDWLTDNVTPVDRTEDRAERVTVPLVFVASSGGASRSAYWTSLLLDCLFTEHPTACDRTGEPLPRSSVFVASGISGGSVGLATWHSSIPDDGETVDLEKYWYDQLYGNDLLAPTLANLLFVDFPNAWLHMNRPDDRAATLERYLEAAADDAFSEKGLLERGLYETSRVDDGGVRWPILILNGASVEDGCRVVGSAMRLVDTRSVESMHRGDVRPDECRTPGDVISGTTESLAGSRAILDFSCTRDREMVDISLSTAAVLSARFPFVTPSGALNNCHDEEDRTFVVDGGTIDSSAAGPVVELLARMQPTIDRFNSTQSDVCVTPVLIQVDNGYLEVSVAEPAKRPAESIAPLQGLMTAVGARADTTRQAAAIAFSAPPLAGADDQGYCPDTKRIVRYVQLVPTAHPGIKSPMGWTLSEQSREDLRKQFRNPTNKGCIAVIKSWFGTPNDGEKECGEHPPGAEE